MLLCSCQTFQRYGYPCHHIFHVMNIYSTEQVKKEWIHIRWFKHYTSHYLSSEATREQNKLYDSLINMHPIGPRFYPQEYDNYPYYKGFEGKNVTNQMFPSSNFVLLCRKTNTCWIRQNNTTDPAIKQLIESKDANLVSVNIELSQQQELIHSQSIEDNENENSFYLDNDNDNSIEINTYPKDHPIFTDKMAMFKRASDLCGNDIDKHKQLYEMLHSFVSSNEIDNCDNDKVLAKRKAHINGGTTIISFNKVLNTTQRSTKRIKACHEK